VLVSLYNLIFSQLPFFGGLFPKLFKSVKIHYFCSCIINHQVTDVTVNFVPLRHFNCLLILDIIEISGDIQSTFLLIFRLMSLLRIKKIKLTETHTYFGTYTQMSHLKIDSINIFWFFFFLCGTIYESSTFTLLFNP
jgi:hypothetical protein